jgi:hypothetical protein
MHNHYKVKEIIVVSPGFKDMLPVVRENADTIICVKRSILNKLGFNKTRMIGTKIDITKGDKNGGNGSEPTKVYYWLPFSTRYTWRRPAYDMFDTYTRRPLKKKEFLDWLPDYKPRKTRTIIKSDLKNYIKALVKLIIRIVKKKRTAETN